MIFNVIRVLAVKHGQEVWASLAIYYLLGHEGQEILLLFSCLESHVLCPWLLQSPGLDHP